MTFGLIVLLCASVAVSVRVHAQPTGEVEKHWSEWMRGPERDLSAASLHFDLQEEHRLESRSCGVKPFNRWAWWMQERGAHLREINPRSWWEESAALRSILHMSDSLNGPAWSYVGPKSIPIYGGVGRVNRVRIDPANSDHWLACAPAGGLWHSWDAGLNWEVLGADVVAPLGASDVWIDPEDSNHLWLATGDANGGDTYSIGLLETWDAGINWSTLELAFEASQGRRVQTIAAHPLQSELLLVATDLGVFRTSNAGNTFELVLAGQGRDVLWTNDSCAVAAIENQGVFLTSDWGQSWQESPLPEANNSLGRIQLAAQAWNGMPHRDTLYAVGGHYFQQNFLAFWQSTDGGQTWTANAVRGTDPNLLGYTVTGADNGGQAFWDLCLAVDPSNSQRVLVGGVNVWETLDGGESWSCPIHWQGASDAAYAHADQHGIAFSEDGSVVIANDGGVFHWADGQVVDRSHGLHVTQGYAVGVAPDSPDRILAGTQDNGTLLLQPTEEVQVLGGDGFHAFFDSSTPNRLFASAYYGLLYRSDDGGRTMTNIANYYQSSGPNELGSWQTPFAMHPAQPGTIVVAKKSLHMSNDGGDTWESYGGMGTTRSTSMALSAQYPEVMLVAKNSQLYHKGTGDNEFAEISGLPGIQIGDVALSRDDSTTWYVTFAGYEPGMQIWRTSDGGESWTDLSNGLPQLPVHRLLELPDGTLICGSDVGVHKWDPENLTWLWWGDGLPLTPVVDLALDEILHRVVASTYGRGLWSIPVPAAPIFAASVTALQAPQTQCMFQLVGAPECYNSGSSDMDSISYVVTAHQGDATVSDTVNHMFQTPIANSEYSLLPSFSLSVPTSGSWDVEISLIHPGFAESSEPFSTILWASGIGHTMTMTWWADCEGHDLRWHLEESSSGSTWIQSPALSPRDTLLLEWCLTEGCFEIVWEDDGNDGFSGSYCGEAGGFELRGPFGEILESQDGTDFGTSLTTAFCIDVPWCFADYNGDGQRAVDDLLNLLSDFGCVQSCPADNNLDGSVGVTDLMNMLSVYGSGCSP